MDVVLDDGRLFWMTADVGMTGDILDDIVDEGLRFG